MQVVPFPALVGAAYRAASPNVATSDCVNFYIEKSESPTDQTFPAMLCPTPGLEAFTENLDGPVRGIFAQDSRVFVVGGPTLYELNGIGTATELGTVLDDANPVSMSSNGHGGHQLCVISSGAGYIYDLNTGVFAQITSPGFPSGAVMVDFLDGYFIVLQATTDTFYLSALFNGLVWTGDAGQVSSSSDSLTALRVIQRNIWLLGTQRSEVWVNVGASFPFAPVPGALIEYGTAARWSVLEADGSLYFISKDERGSAMVMRNSGYNFQRVSTHSVERALSSVSDLSSLRAFSYQEDGHTFCVWTSDAEASQVFDVSTGLWHTRGVWDTNVYQPPLQWCHAYGHGLHLVGSRSEGTVYWQSVQHSTDDGTAIRRQRTCPHLNDRQQWYFGSQVTVGAETGLADSTDPQPVLSLSWSKDGGHTYSDPIDSSLGTGGMYARLVKWSRSPGKFADLVLRVTTTAKTPVRLFSCYLRLESGTEMR